MIERTPRPADEKVQRIIHWRESIITLPDEQFFELIQNSAYPTKSRYSRTLPR